MKARIMKAHAPDPQDANGMRILKLELYVDMECEGLFTSNVGKDMIMGDSEGQKQKLLNVLRQEGILASGAPEPIVVEHRTLCRGDGVYYPDSVPTACPGCRGCNGFYKNRANTSGPDSALGIVEAPGDLCGGTKVITTHDKDGFLACLPCAGCRACS